jgi:hypothetical protein
MSDCTLLDRNNKPIHVNGPACDEIMYLRKENDALRAENIAHIRRWTQAEYKLRQQEKVDD